MLSFDIYLSIVIHFAAATTALATGILAMLPNKTDVLIVGAGPTGLTLATKLARRGISHLIIDRLDEHANTSRAAVVHARTLEVLSELSISDRLISAGIKVPRFTVRARDQKLLTIRFDHLPSPYPFTLMVPQNEIEDIITFRLRELGSTIHRGIEAVGLEQDEGGVTARLQDGRTIAAQYAVGADGLHSIVRQSAGIDFDGGTYEQSFLLADVHMKWAFDASEVMLFFSPEGLVVVAPLPRGHHRIVATVDEAREHPDLSDVQAILDARGPVHSKAQIQDVVWSSRFRVQHRVARRYRNGRMILAGDAAHVHSPAGGQGMNTGIQDASFLGGLLPAALIEGPAGLDVYEAKRRPVALDVVRLTDRLTGMATLKGGLQKGLRNVMLRTLDHVPGFRSALARKLSQLDAR